MSFLKTKGSGGGRSRQGDGSDGIRVQAISAVGKAFGDYPNAGPEHQGEGESASAQEEIGPDQQGRKGVRYAGGLEDQAPKRSPKEERAIEG